MNADSSFDSSRGSREAERGRLFHRTPQSPGQRAGGVLRAFCSAKVVGPTNFNSNDFKLIKENHLLTTCKQFMFRLPKSNSVACGRRPTPVTVQVPVSRVALLIPCRYSSSNGGNNNNNNNNGKEPPFFPDPNHPSSMIRGRRKRHRIMSLDKYFDFHDWASASMLPTTTPNKSDSQGKRQSMSPFSDISFPGKQAPGNQYQPNSPVDPFTVNMNGAHKKRQRPNFAADASLDEAQTIEEYAMVLEQMLSKTNPRLIRDFLDSYVIGQNEAKQSLSCAVYNHYSRVYYNLLRRKEGLAGLCNQ